MTLPMTLMGMALCAAIALYVVAVRDRARGAELRARSSASEPGRGFALAGAVMAVGIALILGGRDQHPESTVQAGEHVDPQPNVYRYSGDRGPAPGAGLPGFLGASKAPDGPDVDGDGLVWEPVQR
jgi:hypothetical protein